MDMGSMGMGSMGIGNVGKSLDGSFKQCDSAFKKGINKAKSIRNRKAKRKVKPHIPKLQKSHEKSNKTMKDAREQGHGAQDVFMKNQYAKDAQKGGNKLKSLMPKNMKQMRGGMKKNGMNEGMNYKAPVNLGSSFGEGNYGQITKAQPLMSNLTRFQGYQQQIGQGMQQCFMDGKKQMKTNQQFSKNIQEHTKMAKQFGIKEKLFGVKEKMFKNISKTLNKVGDSLDKAAQGIDQAAQGIEQAANAVQAVPYVGPAIAAALRMVAKMLRMVAKMLKQIAKQMKNMAKTMDQKAKMMGQQKKLMNTKKKLEEKLAKMFQQKLKMGKQRLGEYSESSSGPPEAAKDVSGPSGRHCKKT